jgi:hypothetical protein
MQMSLESEFAAKLLEDRASVDDIAKLNLSELMSSLSPGAEASLYAIGKYIEKRHKVQSVAEICEKLEIPIMTENRTRKEVLMKVLLPSHLKDIATPNKNVLQEREKLATLSRRVFDVVTTRTGLRVTCADDTKHVTPWLRSELLAIYREGGVTYGDLAHVTGIPEKTLEKYQMQRPLVFHKSLEPETRTKQLEEYWYAAPNPARKTIGTFIEYLDRTNPAHGLSHDFIRERTLQLGLRESRSQKLKERNTGAHNLTEFQPLSSWSADGKHIKVNVNGKPYDFLWYAFVCSTTT